MKRSESIMRDVIVLGVAIALAQSLTFWWRDGINAVEISRPDPVTKEPSGPADNPAPPEVSSTASQARPTGFNPMHPWLP